MGRMDQSFRSETYEQQFKTESFSEQTGGDLVHEARRLHAMSYVNEGFIVPEAVQANGELPPSIDKDRGDNVRYFLGREAVEDGSFGEAVVACRKLGLAEGSSPEGLPGFRLANDNLSDESRQYLTEQAEAGHLREIGSLARRPHTHPANLMKLLRGVLHEARGNDEKLLFTIVDNTYKYVAQYIRPETMRVLGEPISFHDTRISDKVRLLPVSVEVDRYLSTLVETVQNEHKSELERRLAARSFMFFSTAPDGKEVAKVEDEPIDVSAIRKMITQSMGSNE